MSVPEKLGKITLTELLSMFADEDFFAEVLKRYNAYAGQQTIIIQLVKRLTLISHTLNSAKVILAIQEKADLKAQSTTIPYDGLYIKPVIQHIEDDIRAIDMALAAAEKAKGE